MIYIRQTNPEVFRTGEWAHLFSIQYNEHGQDIWIVEFADGAKDAWPSWDSDAGYDVRVQIEAPEVFHGNQGDEARPSIRDAAANLLAQFAWHAKHDVSSGGEA